MLDKNKNIVEKKRIAFFINSMSGGGAEKIVQLLLEQFSKDSEFEIMLILLEKEIVYQLPKDIKMVFLFSNFNNFLQKFIYLFIGSVRLKNIIKKYEIKVIISFLERSNFVNIITKIIGGKHKTIISEHTNPEYAYRDSIIKNIIVKFLLKLLYNRADRIIAVSNGVKKTLSKVFKIKKEKIQVIYNPIDIAKINELSTAKIRHPWFADDIPIIITVGRLIKPKAQLSLIKIFASVRKKILCRLVIIGEGNLKGQLEELARLLNVEKDITFLGWQKNPYKYMHQSTLFALTSLWEGFGIVLVEAMICGLPVISTDCVAGPREILSPKWDFISQNKDIEYAEYGVLVPLSRSGNKSLELTNEEKLYSTAVTKILMDKKLREKYVDKGMKRSLNFDYREIIPKLKNLLLGYFN